MIATQRICFISTPVSLDLAVEGTFKPGEWMTLEDAFDESLLPMKVDVVELGLVDAEFRERIEKDFVVVQGAGVAA